jgi:hypothetical protein
MYCGAPILLPRQVVFVKGFFVHILSHSEVPCGRVKGPQKRIDFKFQIRMLAFIRVDDFHRIIVLSFYSTQD